MNHGMGNPSGIHIQYYNAIARTLTALGMNTAELAPNTSVVTQNNLDTLRSAVRSLADSTLDYDNFNNHRTEEDAFDKYRMSVNGKKGFLVVPAAYTDSAKALFQYEYDAEKDETNQTDYALRKNDLKFTSVPVFYEHFADMMEVLKTLKYIIMNGELFRTDPVKSDEAMITMGAVPAGTPLSPPIAQGPELPCYSRWGTSRYPALTPTFTYTSCVMRVYFKAQRKNNQSVWEDLESPYRIFCLKHDYTAKTQIYVGLLEETTHTLWVDDEAPNSQSFYQASSAPDYSIPEAILVGSGYYIYYRHIVYVVPDEFQLPPPIMLDHPENGLIYCGCEDDDFAKVSIRGANEIRYGLGSSSNAAGARMRLYVTNLFMPDFDAYCMSRYTPMISEFGSVGSAVRDGQTIRFRFSTLIRPNGALVPMYWLFDGETTTFARPITECGYRLYSPATNVHEVAFEDRAVHVFDYRGQFSQAYLKEKDGILHGSWDGVAVTAAAGPPPVCTVVSPQGTVLLNYAIQTIEGLREIYFQTPKLYGHTAVVSGGMKRGFIHKLLLNPTVETPTIADLSVVSEGYIILSSTGAATTTVTGPADQPYSTTRAQWDSSAAGPRTREITHTVNGASWTVQEEVAASGRGASVLKRTAGAESAQPLETNYAYCDNGLLQSEINPDGSWVYRVYDDFRRLLREFRPFGNAGFDPEAGPNPAQCDVTEYSYTANAPDELMEPGDDRVRMTVRMIQGVEVERSYRVYLDGEFRSIRCRAAGAAWDAPDNLVSTAFSYPSGTWKGRHWKTLNPDGTLEITSYQAAAPGLVETTDSGVPNAAGTAVIDGSRRITTRNALGFATAREIRDISSDLRLDLTTYVVDFAGRPTRTVYADGSESSAVYACCGPYKETGRDGTVTIHTYTPDKRPAGVSRAGLQTTYTYAPNGAVAETRTVGADGSYLLAVNDYADNGLLAATRVALAAIPASDDPPEADDAYAVTTYAEGPAGGFWRKTVTDPEGGVRAEDYDRSGALRRVSGSAAAAETEFETLLVDNEVCSRSVLVRPGNLRETTDVLSNFSGLQYKTIYPGGSYSLTEYDAFNRPIQQIQADGTVRITEYNLKGEVARSGVDLDRDGVLGDGDPATWFTDEAALKTVGAEEIAVRRRTTREQEGAELVTTGAAESTVDGSRSWQTAFGRVKSFRRSYIDDGEERGVTETTVQPDGVTETRSYSNGLLESSTHSVLGETLYSYDEFNRTASISRLEGGVERVVSYEYDGRNLPVKVTETGGTRSRETSFTYDLNGRKLSETRPGGRTITYQYHPTGELKQTSGAETYPRSYTYEAGRLATLTTWRNAPELPEITAWHYNSYGQLAAKEYADASRTQYLYNAAGQLAARTWARNRSADYAYDNAGRISHIEYDGNDTAAISYVYDQRNRLAEISDAAGVHTITYHPDSTPATETLPQAGDRLLRRSCDALGRPSELRLGEAGRAFLCFNGDPVRGIRRIDATPDSSKMEFAMGPWEDRADLPYQPVNTVFTYDGTNYDDFGRPETDPGFGKHKENLAPYLIDDTADGVFVQYRYGADGRLRQTVTPGGIQTTAYLAGANLAASRTWQPESGQTQHITYDYDEYQRLTDITRNGLPTTGYELNAADQRTQTTLPDGTAWNYTYDDLGQLATATRGATNAMAYSYDTIGNRLTASEDGDATAYSANNLNQYTAINQASPTYDADGNLLTCNGWTYTWNAENRLIRATDGATTVEADYDYMGRRFVKKVYNGQTLITHQHFLYDGYKLIAICDALDGNKITTTFTWQPTGPDVPLTMTHAGETCHYLTDGNKNVLKLLRPNGTCVATYAYAPFGQPLAASGPWAELNPFRFSSEYHDDETDLVYYNYRHYSPELGRWLSRDPIEEKGGVNPYCFVYNGLIGFDELGLSEVMSVTEFFGRMFDFRRNFMESIHNITVPFKDVYNVLFGKKPEPPYQRYPNMDKYLDCIDKCVKEHVRIIIASAGVTTLSLPIVPKTIPGAAGGSMRTSIISALSSKLPDLPFRLPAPTPKTGLKGKTNNLGRFLGRWASILGPITIGIEIGAYNSCLENCLNPCPPAPPINLWDDLKERKEIYQQWIETDDFDLFLDSILD